jgi:hypothetical protein
MQRRPSWLISSGWNGGQTHHTNERVQVPPAVASAIAAREHSLADSRLQVLRLTPGLYLAETEPVDRLETMFEQGLTSTSEPTVEKSARLASVAARLEGVARGTGHVRAAVAQGLPVPGPLAGLLPRGLERGGVLAVGSDRYLAASLVGSAVRSAGSVAVVGVDDLGIEALCAAGVPMARLVVVRTDATTWVKAVEVLVGAVEVVLLRPPASVAQHAVRSITARLRRTAAVDTALLVTGTASFQAPMRLRVTETRWSGLEAGHGQLTARRATVVVDGKATGGGARAAEMYLPGPDGAVQAIEVARPVDELAARRRLVAA